MGISTYCANNKDPASNPQRPHVKMTDMAARAYNGGTEWDKRGRIAGEGEKRLKCSETLSQGIR